MHVSTCFSSDQIKELSYNFFQSCGISENWDWGKNPVAGKGCGEGHMGGDFLGRGDPRGHHANKPLTKSARLFICCPEFFFFSLKISMTLHF